ncbi:32779_t:CDS:2 [Gigaspora margarita]|uniref:32779_t:CDS:1 n=1 Tax=Gigaspora margarita TaxID=4874 RepID=A0ABM8W605_GIGMA|nr:32779_t:CDS:2 [Gigaspora margarita]
MKHAQRQAIHKLPKTLTNYGTVPAKEKQNPGLQKKICCKPKSTNNDDTGDDQKALLNEDNQRARTPTPVNDDDMTALTRRKTKVPTLP